MLAGQWCCRAKERTNFASHAPAHCGLMALLNFRAPCAERKSTPQSISAIVGLSAPLRLSNGSKSRMCRFVSPSLTLLLEYDLRAAILQTAGFSNREGIQADS